MRDVGTADLEVHAAIGRGGDLTAAYISRRRMLAPNPIGVATVTAAGEVAGDRVIPDGRDSHYDPWLATDSERRLYAVWLGFDGGRAPEKRMQVGLSTSLDGKTWSPTVAAHDADTDCPGETPGCLDKPMIAIGPDKRNRRRDAIYVAYEAEQGQKVVKSTDGGKTFSASVKAAEHGYGSMMVDRRGNLHLVSASSAEGGQHSRIEYVRSTDGGERFSAPVVVSAPGEPVAASFVNPQVAVDARRGVIYVAYPAGSGPRGSRRHALEHPARRVHRRRQDVESPPAVYASQPGSPRDHARLASGWRMFPLAGRDFHPLGSSVRFQLSSSFPLHPGFAWRKCNGA